MSRDLEPTPTILGLQPVQRPVYLQSLTVTVLRMWSLASALALALYLASADQQSEVSDELHTIRVCVSSEPEGASCSTLTDHFSNHSRLRVACQARSSFQQCCREFEANDMDVVSLNPRLIDNYTQLYRKDAYQQIDDLKENEMPVVIVNKTSKIHTIIGARVEKACLSNLTDIPSWWRMYVFSMSRASHGRYSQPYSHRYRTGMNIGRLIVTDDPLACLGSDDTGVAMMGRETAIKKFDGPWRAEDYELVCWPPGGRQPVPQYNSCNWYRLNFKDDSSEVNKGKEILKGLVHLYLQYSHVDYYDLIYNYKGDLKVFFSEAKSGADLMREEFAFMHYP